MTGKAFLRRLLIHLDFMSEEDKKTVVSYYEKRIESARDPQEEEKIVEEFGSPEHIADMLRLNLSKSSTQQIPVEKESDAGQTRVFSDDLTDSPPQPENIAVSDSQPQPSTPPAETLFQEEEAEQVTLFGDEEEKDRPLDPIFPEVKDVFEPDGEMTEVTPPAEKPEEDAGAALPSAPKKENGAGKDSDLIFSKPVSSGSAEEIVHAMENPEIPPLYGEKVILPKEETGEIKGIDLSSPNSPTPEEVEEAKARTLAKAQTYNTESFGAVRITDEIEAPADPEKVEKDPAPGDSNEVPAADSDEESKIIPLEVETGEMQKKEEKNLPGVFNQLFEKTSLSDSAKKTLTILISVLLSPILLFVGVAVGAGFAILYIGVALSAALLFLIMVILVIGAVIELVYGFATFKVGIATALIELGIGLALSGIVCAVSALIYEYLFGIVPRAMRAITRWLKKTYRILYSFLYGGTV